MMNMTKKPKVEKKDWARYLHIALDTLWAYEAYLYLYYCFANMKDIARICVLLSSRKRNSKWSLSEVEVFARLCFEDRIIDSGIQPFLVGLIKINFAGLPFSTIRHSVGNVCRLTVRILLYTAIAC